MRNPKGIDAFGTHLRRLREAVKPKLSQQQLANDAGISKITVQRIENAKFSASLDVQISLAKALKISLAKLMDFPLPKEKEMKEKDRIRKKK